MIVSLVYCALRNAISFRVGKTGGLQILRVAERNSKEVSRYVEESLIESDDVCGYAFANQIC